MKMTIRGIKEKIRETLKMVRMAQLEFRSWVHNSKNHAVVLPSKLKLWHVLDLLDQITIIHLLTMPFKSLYGSDAPRLSNFQ